MVNAAFTCGNPEEIRNTNDMVENQTQRLESFAMGNGLNSSTLGSQPECSLGNPPRVTRKGGIPAPSSQTATGVPKRKTQRCGICGREGHNRKSCQFQSEPLLNSQDEEFELLNRDDEADIYESDDCNIDMDVF